MNDDKVEANTGEVLARKRRAAVDADDFNNELADRDTGRMRRFLSHGQTAATDRNRKKDSERDLLWMLSNDGQRQELGRRLAELEAASRRALKRAEERLDRAQTELESIRASAMRDSTGRRVYRTQNGVAAFDDYGTRLSDAEVENVHWRAGAPSWEQFNRVTDEQHHAAAEVDDVGAYLDQLDMAKGRLEGGGDLTADELRELEMNLGPRPTLVAEELAPVAAGPQGAGVPLAVPASVPTKSLSSRKP